MVATSAHEHHGRSEDRGAAAQDLDLLAHVSARLGIAVESAARSRTHPKRLVSVSSNSPTPEIRITGAMASCRMGIRWTNKLLFTRTIQGDPRPSAAL